MKTRLIACPGASLNVRAWAKGLAASGRVVLVSEPLAYSNFGAPLCDALKAAGLDPLVHLLPRGEDAKTWPAVERLCRALLAEGLGRDAAVIALGGGAVTDSAGFAAAVYLRGLPWASLPTTLLGQLDSGLGGKTAINLPEGKNLVGAFHQPSVVVCDTDFLRTLPERERVSGLAEALKYGLVFDPGYWRTLTTSWPNLLAGEPKATAAVVAKGAAWKLKIVAKDERETKGPRELLNFGHTLGHALETCAGHGALRHGEAVIFGMRAALRLSHKHAGLPAKEAVPVEDFLKALPVPLPSGLYKETLLEAARRDKKARAGRLRFVLLKRLGRPVVTDAVPESSVLETLDALLEPPR